MMFVSCGNNNTKNEQEAQNEPAVEQTVAEEAPAQEEAAPEPITYDHYEWTMTLPEEGWKVDNAYSEMGLERVGEYVYFLVKDWKNTSLEKCTKNGGCLEENRQEDIVTGDITWNVYTNANKNKVACYTFVPEHNNMVVCVSSEEIEDPKDARLMAVLQGFAVKHLE